MCQQHHRLGAEPAGQPLPSPGRQVRGDSPQKISLRDAPDICLVGYADMAAGYRVAKGQISGQLADVKCKPGLLNHETRNLQLLKNANMNVRFFTIENIRLLKGNNTNL